jgi:hypothetical protein
MPTLPELSTKTATHRTPPPLAHEPDTSFLHMEFPICWGSKLQTEIALSTTEAEYIALSTATREALGLRNLLTELSTQMDISKKFTFTTLSQVFEDNNGALTLA